MTPITYSRGVNIRDNAPITHTAPSFEAFVDALDRDRAPDKASAPYIAAAMNGTGRRCAEGALPRRWTAVDLDKIDVDAREDVNLWMARFSGVAWETHSSRPDAPRERVILELSRDVSRDESIRIGDVLTRDLIEEFGDRIKVDRSTYRPEQPIFAVPEGAVLCRFLGDPLDADKYLEKGLSDAPETPQRGPHDEDDLVRQIEAGEDLHDNLKRLIARWVAKGMDEAAVRAAAQGLLEKARRVRGDRVDQLAGEELDRLVSGAFGKYAPGAGPPPLDILRDFVAPPLDPADFPAVVRDYAALMASAAGHDVSAYLLAMTTATAAMITDEIKISLDPRTKWRETPRLWSLLIGPPGAAKSPAIVAAVNPVISLHCQMRDRWEDTCRQIEEDADKPPRPSLYVSNATTEALSEALHANPRGLLYTSHELDSWLGMHDAYRGGMGSKDRGDWLQLYDGGPYEVQRVKRGVFLVPNWGVSLLAATTPAGLKRHSGSLPADGLIQRLLPVMIRPMTAADLSIAKEDVDEAGKRYAARLRTLHDYIESFDVALSSEAAEVFATRHAELRDEVEAMTTISAPLAAHLAKHAGLLGRLALVLHAVTVNGHPAEETVSGETMASAVRVLRQLARHAAALYSSLSGEDDAATLARAVARSLLADKASQISKSEVMHSCRPFRDAAEAQRDSALRTLEDYGWIVPIDTGRRYAGKPAHWYVDPRVHDLYAAHGEAMRDRRRKVRDAIRGLGGA